MCIFCSTFACFFGRFGLTAIETLKTFETIKTLFILIRHVGQWGS